MKIGALRQLLSILVLVFVTNMMCNASSTQIHLTNQGSWSKQSKHSKIERSTHTIPRVLEGVTRLTLYLWWNMVTFYLAAQTQLDRTLAILLTSILICLWYAITYRRTSLKMLLLPNHAFGLKRSLPKTCCMIWVLSA